MRAGLAGARGPVEGDFLPISPGPVILLLAFLIRLRMGALALAAVPTQSCSPHPGDRPENHILLLSPTPPPQVYRKSWGLTAGKSWGVLGKAQAVIGTTMA